MKLNRIRGGTALIASLTVIAACDYDTTGPGSDFDPESLTVSYEWVFQRWEQNTPRGYGVVNLNWELPAGFSDEIFRVYARSGTAGGYTLIATVTSCSNSVCRYGDTNIVAGRSYDYYIASVDQRDNNELGTSEAVRIDVPAAPSLPVPAVTAISLDRAAYVRWSPTGAQRYMVLSQTETGPVFLIGETDGTSFYDSRAENGTRFRYFVAGIDEFGHVSGLSTGADAFPRPDYHADVIYAHFDNPAQSGFRFVDSDTEDPIVSGNAVTAQWRLEAVGSVLRIVPLGQTRITQGMFTTSLTCGPGSESNCVDIRLAPPDSQFGTASVAVETGFTYMLRTIGSDNRVHYAKLRVDGSSVDNQNRRLIVFDWAYQVRPDERTLVRVGE